MLCVNAVSVHLQNYTELGVLVVKKKGRILPILVIINLGAKYELLIISQIVRCGPEFFFLKVTLTFVQGHDTLSGHKQPLTKV